MQALATIQKENTNAIQDINFITWSKLIRYTQKSKLRFSLVVRNNIYDFSEKCNPSRFIKYYRKYLYKRRFMSSMQENCKIRVQRNEKVLRKSRLFYVAES